jgi:uncharacterized membrane protein
MQIEIFLSIISALLIAISDFLAKFRDSDRHLTYPLMSMSLIGAIFFYVYGKINGDNVFEYNSYSILCYNVISGVTNVLALLFLYEGIRRGPVSVVAPMAMLSSVFLALKWYFLGVILSMEGYVGTIISISGAIILCIKFKNDTYSCKHLIISSMIGVVAGFFFSARLFCMQLASKELNLSAVVFQSRCIGVVFTLLLIGFYRARGDVILPNKNNFSLKEDIVFPLLQALTGSLGIILLLIASVGNYVVMAPAIFSVNAGFTVLLSAYYFHEKITYQKITGLIIMMIGILILKLS